MKLISAIEQIARDEQRKDKKRVPEAHVLRNGKKNRLKQQQAAQSCHEGNLIHKIRLAQQPLQVLLATAKNLEKTMSSLMECLCDSLDAPSTSRASKIGSPLPSPSSLAIGSKAASAPWSYSCASHAVHMTRQGHWAGPESKEIFPSYLCCFELCV